MGVTGMRPVRGFTLIELMVTIAVLAIIAMLAAPSFSDMISRQNLNSSADNLTATFSQARAKAVLERRNITVILGTQAQANTGTVLNWAPSGQTIQKAASGSTGIGSIVFRPDGLIQDPQDTTKPLNSNIDILLCNQPTSAKYSKTITISFLGNIRNSGIQGSGGCSS